MLFPHPHTQTIAEIPEIPFSEPDLSIQGTSLWPLNNSYGVHWADQADQKEMGVHSTEGVVPLGQSNLPGQRVHVFNRSAHGNRKAVAPRQA